MQTSPGVAAGHVAELSPLALSLPFVQALLAGLSDAAGVRAAAEVHQARRAQPTPEQRR
jgi:hypothetical protein